MKRRLLILVLALGVVSVPVYAHHSFASYYFEKQTMSVEGEVVKFDYRSPHAWVYIVAKDEKGQTLQYAAEWFNPNRLKQQGITANTIKPGDHVILVGSPGRNPADQRLHLKGIQRPADGWKSGITVAAR